MKRQFLLIGLLLAIVLLSGCTLLFRVSGTVVDAASGAPVSGAIVEIEELDISSATDSSGKFVLENVSSGQRTLKVSKESYISLKVDLVVEETDLELGALGLVENPTLETGNPLESVKVLGKEKSGQMLQENQVLSDYYNYASELGFVEMQEEEKFIEAELADGTTGTIAVFLKPESGEMLYLFSVPEDELPYFAKVSGNEAGPIEVFGLNEKILQITEDGITFFSGDENVFIAYENGAELQLQGMKTLKLPPPDKPSALSMGKCYTDCVLNCISPNKVLSGTVFALGQVVCRACPTAIGSLLFSEGLSTIVAVPACASCATYLLHNSLRAAKCWRETCSRYPGIYSTYEDREDDKWPNICDTCPRDYNPEQEPVNCRHCPKDYMCDWYKHCSPGNKCVDCLEDKHCIETATYFDQDSDCRTYSCKQYKCESVPDPAKDGKPCLVGGLLSGYTATCQNGECIVSLKQSVCGDGVCEGNENLETCFEDCYKEECGNGICGEGEDHDNCPGDCDPPEKSFCEEQDEFYLAEEGYSYNKALATTAKAENTILCRWCAYNSVDGIWEDFYVDRASGSGPLDKVVAFYLEADSGEYFYHSFTYPSGECVPSTTGIAQYSTPSQFMLTPTKAGEYKLRIRKIDETAKEFGPPLTFTWNATQ